MELLSTWLCCTEMTGDVAHGLEPVTFAEVLNYLHQSDLLEKYQVVLHVILM